MTAINAVLGWIRQVIGLIFPLFKSAVDFTKWGRWTWYVLHFVVIAAITVGLWWLENYYMPVRTWLFDMLRSTMPQMHGYFLPCVFLLIYALSWILRWIWLQLGPEAEVNEFPDITSAWLDGISRIASKGVKPADLPLYLILGRTKAGDEFLFKAGQVPIEVFGPPVGDPPVRVWASRQAIYVTATGASALGTYADMLARGPGELTADQSGDAAKKTLGLGDDESLDATVQEINALRALARTRELTADEKARMRELAVAAQQKPTKTKVQLSADAAKEASDRLRYLCKLIARDRRPYCPLNGIMTLLPWEAIESDEPAKSTALALRTDLMTTRYATRQCAPTIGLVCDLEEARGFEQFRAGFSAENLAARIGQRFPLVPDQPLGEQPALYESGSQWLGERLFPGRVYQALQLDVGDPRALAARNLFHLFRSVQERLPRLGRVLRSGLPLPTGGQDGLDGPLLFAGCYLAGTGRDGNLQAFVPGVFERLTKNQGIVAWTQTAVTEDAAYRRSATIGYVVVALAAAGLAVAAWLLWKK